MLQYGYNVHDCDDRITNPMFRIDNPLDWQGGWTACHAVPGGNLASIRTFEEYRTLVALTEGVLPRPNNEYGYVRIGL